MYPIVTLFILMLGLYYIFSNPTIENFKNNNQSETYSCPDLLIQKGNEFHLKNSRLADIPGVNPLKFNNLNEYVEFTKWQRSQGINCPVLFFQFTYDIQGKPVYKARPSPTNLKGGLPDVNMSPIGRESTYKILNEEPSDKFADPGNSFDGRALLMDAGRDDKPYNTNSYPAYDHDNQNIGLHTPLDDINNRNQTVSPNPIDPNWGGHNYTQMLVDNNVYVGSDVSRPIQGRLLSNQQIDKHHEILKNDNYNTPSEMNNHSEGAEIQRVKDRTLYKNRYK